MKTLNIILVILLLQITFNISANENVFQMNTFSMVTDNSLEMITHFKKMDDGTIQMFMLNETDKIYYIEPDGIHVYTISNLYHDMETIVRHGNITRFNPIETVIFSLNEFMVIYNDKTTKKVDFNADNVTNFKLIDVNMDGLDDIVYIKNNDTISEVGVLINTHEYNSYYTFLEATDSKLTFKNVPILAMDVSTEKTKEYKAVLYTIATDVEIESLLIFKLVDSNKVMGKTFLKNNITKAVDIHNGTDFTVAVALDYFLYTSRLDKPYNRINVGYEIKQSKLIDFNQDGIEDLVLLGVNGEISIYNGSLKGNLTLSNYIDDIYRNNFSYDSILTNIDVIDVDGDTRLDIIVTGLNMPVSAYIFNTLN